jgi:hypothetical protein
MLPEAVHISPGIYFTAEENSEKPHLGDRRESCNQSLPQMGSLTYKWDLYDRTERQEWKRKERKDGVLGFLLLTARHP